jgi:integrase
MLLLCADLGLRHRTASSIALSNYRPNERAISFKTKGNTYQTLPVTEAIRKTIESIPATADRSQPIANLLRGHRPGTPPGQRPRFSKQWKSLRPKLGIRPELRIHDLRRTVAEEVWDATQDIRAVQAQLGHRSPVTTARYLANRITLKDLRPIFRKVSRMREQRRQRRTAPNERTPWKNS